MASAPPANDRARPERLELVRTLGAVAVLGVLVALVWCGAVLLAPADEATADGVAVIGAEHESAEVGAIAGMRRSALTVASPLRAVERDLAGFTDPTILAEIADELAALDAVLAGGDAAAMKDAVARVSDAVPPLLVRVVADAEARIAAGASADSGVVQAARASTGAVRGSGGSPTAEQLASMRVAVEAVTASHAAAVEAERLRAAAEAEGDSTGDGSGGSDVPTSGDDGMCADGTFSYDCMPALTVTALGAHVSSCPAGTLSHVFDVGIRSGAVTLDYPFEYEYTADGNHLSVMHCDPEGWGDSPAHGPGPLPDPPPQG